MGYSGYDGPRGPRPLRVILGGGIAIACCLIGTIVMTHEYHRALMMEENATEVDWHTLANNGPTENAFVCLIDVELDETNELGELDEMLADFDPDDGDAVEAFVESMERVNALDMIEMAVAPIAVVPKGAVLKEIPRAILIPRNDAYIEEAKRQLEETGTLSGFISTYQGDEFARAVMAYTGGEELLDEVDAETQQVYTIEPMAEALDRSRAASNFWFCGLGLAFGLILCGSGGPALQTCVFFTAPSIISLFGYPMRYGRGSNTTRAIYLLAGAGLMFYGYQALINQGGFGQTGGSSVLQAIGFMSTFIGLAAVLSVPSQMLSRKIESSLDVAPSPKQEEQRMSVADACSLEPIESDNALYRDGELVTDSGEDFPDEMKWSSEALSAIGFCVADPLLWIHDDESTSHCAVQLGCRNMVVSEIESKNERMQCRLVSVLHDGMTVITLSTNIQVGSNRRVGSNGMYLLSKSCKPEEMLSQHLEETIGIAERRDTTVVSFEEAEVNDVCHFARRVLADIRNQYGEVPADIDAAEYGRFSYPMQTVSEHADATLV